MKLNLLEKLLNWSHKPFQIPNKILNEWKKIGKKGEP